MNTSEKIYPRRILLAVDGSDHSQAAINLLSDLPLPSRCQLTILSVLIPRNAQYFETLQDILDKTEAFLQRDNLEIITKLLTGYPAEKIVEFANHYHPDLIIIGAKGLRATLGILLGGVAQQVVEYACCPVLIIRAPYQGLKNILFVTDGSECSDWAAEYWGKFTFPEESQNHVLHVLPPLFTPEAITQTWLVDLDVIPPLPPPEFDLSLSEQAKAEEDSGNLLLGQTMEKLHGYGVQASIAIRRGDAATEIIKYSNEISTDIIITGSRGLSQFQSWLLGSVSRKLVHYANSSVLVVKDIPG
jgi:nucleotide-binding universal stress UspA family protein